MDSRIISAIIGAIGEIFEALLRVVAPKRKDRKREESFHKAKAFNLGFSLGALDYFVKAQKIGLSTESLPQAINHEYQRCKALAEAIGLNPRGSPKQLLDSLPIQMEGKPSSIWMSFKIGNIVGRGYFFGITLIAAGAVPADDRLLQRLTEAENLLSQAELPNGFLLPVRKLWERTIAEAQEGRADVHSVWKEMEQIIDQLTTAIERAQ